MTAVFKREFSAAMHNLVGFAYLSLLLLATGIFTLIYNLSYGVAGIEYIMSSLAIVMALLTPVMTMRTLMPDKKYGTDRFLYSLPLSSRDIVLGKYAALLAPFAISVGALLPLPLILNFFGNVNFAAAYASIFAYFLMGCAIIALCMYISSLFKHIAVSGAVTYAALVLLYLMGAFAVIAPSSSTASLIGLCVVALLVAAAFFGLSKSPVVAVVAGMVVAIPTLAVYIICPSCLEGILPSLLSGISVFARFDSFVYGVFDLPAVIYFISFTAVFVFLSVFSLEKRRAR